jgi:hypothetical protein
VKTGGGSICPSQAAGRESGSVSGSGLLPRLQAGARPAARKDRAAWCRRVRFQAPILPGDETVEANIVHRPEQHGPSSGMLQPTRGRARRILMKMLKK